MFDSPEALLGLAADALDEYKFSSTKIDSNFRGVRYDTADFVGPVDLGTMSSGILIVHNGSTTAKLHINNGNFKGLIICDDIEKFNGEVQIRGAVVVLKNSSVIFDGLGNSSVCYSSEILANLTDYCDNIKTEIHELSWREVN